MGLQPGFGGEASTLQGGLSLNTGGMGRGLDPQMGERAARDGRVAGKLGHVNREWADQGDVSLEAWDEEEVWRRDLERRGRSQTLGLRKWERAAETVTERQREPAAGTVTERQREPAGTAAFGRPRRWASRAHIFHKVLHRPPSPQSLFL